MSCYKKTFWMSEYNTWPAERSDPELMAASMASSRKIIARDVVQAAVDELVPPPGNMGAGAGGYEPPKVAVEPIFQTANAVPKTPVAPPKGMPGYTGNVPSDHEPFSNEQPMTTLYPRTESGLLMSKECDARPVPLYSFAQLERFSKHGITRLIARLRDALGPDAPPPPQFGGGLRVIIMCMWW